MLPRPHDVRHQLLCAAFPPSHARPGSGAVAWVQNVISCAGAFRDAGGQPLVVDGAYIRQWIHMRYKACNFKRYMSESDMSVRAQRFLDV